MTTLKTFAIAANGTPFGEWTAETADAAILAYVQDAGFKTVEDAAATLDQSVEKFLGDIDVEEVDVFSVKSVEWLHEDTFTMITVHVAVDGSEYHASEYYDVDNDDICTSADAHMNVCGISNAKTGDVYWPSVNVEKKILQAMRDFVEVELPQAA